MRGSDSSRILDAAFMAAWTIWLDYRKAKVNATIAREEKTAASNSLMGALFVLAETIDAAEVDVLDADEGERTLSILKTERELLTWACAHDLLPFAEFQNWLQKNKELGLIE